MTSITIPPSVTSIGVNAFNYASNLASVIFEAGSLLDSIEASAFRNATSLTSVTIPASVTSIGQNAFYGTGITTVLYNENNTMLVYYPQSLTSTSFIIPASVTSIGTGAFQSTSSLTSLTFEEGSQLTTPGLGLQVFSDSGLTTIYAYQSLINGMGWSTTDTNTISGKSGITVELLSPPAPPAPICFPAGTPVTTDQGIIPIERLNPDKHTIRGKEIVAITQTRPLQKHIVCFEKDSLSKNVPSQETRCSKEHKVFYKCEMMKARDIVELCENVSFVPYNGETLYNVLLKKQNMMIINNLICETLHPENIMAKISRIKDGQKKNKAIQELTKIIKDNNIPEYQKLYASL